MTKYSLLFIAAALVLAVSGVGTLKAQEAPTETMGSPANVTVSPDEAFAVFAVEAEKGNVEAMLNLGALYENGIGTPRHFGRAFEWYKKAAEAGSAAAMYNLGVCYEIGMGVSYNVPSAFEWYKKAAEAKLPQGAFKTALMYRTGQGVQQNEAEAVKYLNEAAALNHPLAANELGVIYAEGRLGQKKDFAKAADALLKSASLGYVEAAKNLAVLYNDKQRKEADPAKSLRWYQTAMIMGFDAPDLGGIVEALKKEVGAAGVKKAETEALGWVKGQPWGEGFLAQKAAYEKNQAAPKE